MSKLSQSVGLILMVLGVASYVLSGMVSPTALIPAFFGMVISGLGYYGRHEQTSTTAMRLALGLAVVGVLGSVRGLMSLPALLTGADVASPAAIIAQSLMALVLIGYLVKGLPSLVAAKRS